MPESRHRLHWDQGPIVVAVVATLFIAVFTAFLVESYSGGLLRQAADTELSIAKAAAESLGKDLEHRMDHLRVLAGRDEFSSALQRRDIPTLAFHLDRLGHEEFMDAYAVGPDRVVISPYAGAGLSSAEWLEAAFDSGQAYISPVHDGPEGGKVLSIVVPVLRMGRRIGVLVDDYPIGRFLGQVGHSSTGGRALHLVDSLSMVYAASGQPKRSFEQCARKALRGESGVAGSLSGGSGPALAYAPVADYGIAVITENLSAGPAYSALGQKAKTYAAAAVVILLVWAVALGARSRKAKHISPGEKAWLFNSGTKRGASEAELEPAALEELSELVTASTGLKQTLESLLGRACEVLGTDMGGVFLKNGSGKMELFCRTDAMPDEFAGIVKWLQSAQGATGSAVSEAGPAVLGISECDEGPLKEKLYGLGIRSVASVPIIIGREVMGFFCFGLQGAGKLLAPRKLRFLAAVGRNASLAARCEGLLQEADSARKQWELAFNSIMDQVCILDKDGRIIRANAEFARYVGSTPEGVAGRKCGEFLGPLFAGGGQLSPKAAFREVHEEITDHEGRTFLASSIPVFEGGEHVCTVRLATDVSAIKAAEEMLREEAEVSSALVQISEVINSFLDKDHLLKEITAIAPQYIKSDALGIFLTSEGRCFYAGGFGLSVKEQEAVLGLLSGKGLRYAGGAGFDECAKQASLALEGLADVALMPIAHKHELLGVLIAANRGGRRIGHRDRGLLRGLSNSLAASLKNAALYAQTEELFFGAVKCLTSAMEAKSPWTRGHSERVTMYAMAIGRRLNLDADSIRKLTLAALLHDVGKIGTVDSILDKPGGLTDEEFRRVQMHPLEGAEIVAGIRQLKDVAEIIKCHHERPDGAGYPGGLKGGNVPILSRIIAVADAYDSMTSVRPYRETPGREYAMEELKRWAGTQFDAAVVNAFLKEFGSS